MKKLIIWLAVAMFTFSTVTQAAPAANEGRGGVMGFIAGCCFGIRTAGAYNSGKEVHWREWVMLVPFVNIVFAVMNGIEGMNGVTTADLAAEYGSTYY